ncbi:MAG TPA: hypothetical protein VFL91_14120, partial [Thermomicrobiales bacterium]|nr:hypothetical protein [Thermomicrobiales bacterium]
HRLRGHVNATLLPPTCSLYFQPDSLLTALYALFALEISGESRPEPRCKECGRAITEGRADRQYCSPLCKTRWTERHRPRRHRGAGVGAAVRQRDG